MQILTNLLNITDYIDFKGHLSLKDVADNMRVADVLVNPRITGETFGYVFAEAIMNDLQIIAFNR